MKKPPIGQWLSGHLFESYGGFFKENNIGKNKAPQVKELRAKLAEEISPLAKVKHENGQSTLVLTHNKKKVIGFITGRIHLKTPIIDSAYLLPEYRNTGIMGYSIDVLTHYFEKIQISESISYDAFKSIQRLWYSTVIVKNSKLFLIAKEGTPINSIK